MDVAFLYFIYLLPINKIYLSNQDIFPREIHLVARKTRAKIGKFILLLFCFSIEQVSVIIFHYTLSSSSCRHPPNKRSRSRVVILIITIHTVNFQLIFSISRKIPIFRGLVLMKGPYVLGFL